MRWSAPGALWALCLTLLLTGCCSAPASPSSTVPPRTARSLPLIPQQARLKGSPIYRSPDLVVLGVGDYRELRRELLELRAWAAAVKEGKQ